MCQRILRDRAKSYDIMKHYVKEKKKLCTFPIYSIIIVFVLVQLVFTLFLSGQVIVYLSIFYFIYVYLPRGPVQFILECSLFGISVNDCHFNPKALLGILNRMCSDC